MIGKVVKGIGGFYYVSDGKEIIQGNARGNLKRRKKDTIYVGDEVEYEIRPEDGECIITKVLPRRNILKRPPVSNLDTLVIVSSAETPEMIPLAVDKLTVYCEITGIRPILVFTKADLASEERMRELENMYREVYPVYPISSVTGEGVDDLRKAVAGQSVASGGSVGRGQIHIAERIDCGCGCGDRKPQREDRPGKAHHAARGNFSTGSRHLCVRHAGIYFSGFAGDGSSGASEFLPGIPGTRSSLPLRRLRAH